jgi:hypothetical protein
MQMVTMMTEEDENGHPVEKGKEKLVPILVEQGVQEELAEQAVVIFQNLNKSDDQKDWLM